MTKNKMIKQQPLISVVMPVYNAEKYLKEAIESILNQTYKNFEFILINDASTDSSLEIINQFARKDKRIKFINNQENKGIAETRNIGIKLSKGKYIATHDADDISLKTRFQEQVDFLEKNPKCGVVGSFIKIFNNTKKNNFSIRKYSLKDKELRNKIFYYSPIAQPASMIRKKALDKIGLYNQKYPPAEDLDLWFRIGSFYEFANIQKVLLLYRVSPESQTSSKLKIMEKLTFEIRNKYKKNPEYNYGFKERLYNFNHLLSTYIIPSRFKLWLFQKVRDSKNE